jgi:hypothetical protein
MFPSELLIQNYPKYYREKYLRAIRTLLLLFSLFLLILLSPEDNTGRACSTNGKKRNTYRILVGKPEGKRPLGRQRCRWVD